MAMVGPRGTLGKLAGAAPVLVAVLMLFRPALDGKVVGGHVLGAPPVSHEWRADACPNAADVEVVMLPFLRHVQRELRAGRVALWNPFQGCGAPFLANEQSAALHPFTLLAVQLPWRHALSVVVLLRLLVAAAGAGLLASDLGMCRFAAASAGAAFALSGAVAHWIAYPVGGVLDHLPLLIFAARRHARSGSLGSTALLTVGLTSSILAGHFEFLPLVWGITALAWAWSRTDRRRLASLAGAMALAASLGAPALLPGIEYLAHGAHPFRWGSGSGYPMASDPRFLAIALDSGLLTPETLVELARRRSGFRIVAHYSLGTTVVVLAACGLRFAGAGLRLGSALSLLLLVDNPLGRQLWSLPVLHLMRVNRLAILPALALSLAAGWGIHALMKGGARPLPACLATLGVAAILLHEPRWFEGYTTLPRPSRWICLALALVLVAVAAATRRHGRAALGVAAAVILLGERSLALPVMTHFSPPSEIYPDLPIAASLARLAGTERIVAEGSILLPNAATVYGLRDVRLYDAIGLRAYEERAVAEGSARYVGTRPLAPSPASREAAARLVLAAAGKPAREEQQLSTTRELPVTGGERIRQPFLSQLGYVTAVMLHVPEDPGPGATLEVALRDASGAELRRGSAPLEQGEASAWRRVAVAPPLWTLPRQPMMLEASVGGGPGAEAPSAATFSAAPRGPRRGAIVAGHPQEVRLAFRVEYGGGLTLHLNRQGGVEVSSDPDAAPRASLARRPRDREAVRFERDDPTHVVLVCASRSADALVLADTHYPGWQATVDGRPTPIAARGPFRSVAVPPGSHRIELTYRPASYTLGLFLACMAGLSCAAIVAGRRRRSRPRPSA